MEALQVDRVFCSPIPTGSGTVRCDHGEMPVPTPATAALLAGVWAPGATYTDPMVHAEGAEALLKHIAGVHQQMPGARIVRTSELQVHHDAARFAWQFTLPGGTSLPEGLDLLSERGFELLALTPDPAAVPLDSLALASQDRVALVLGSEGPGLRDETLSGVVARGGRLVRIPIAAQVDSLNVAAAAAIACYEVGRR